MADGLMIFLKKKMLDAVFGITAYSPPATVYVAALTTMPSDGSGASLVEVTAANNYSRVSVTNNGTNFTNASGAANAAKTTGAAVTFPQASGAWGTVVGVAIYDQSTGGNLLAAAELTVNQSIVSGDTLQLNTGNLTINLITP